MADKYDGWIEIINDSGNQLFLVELEKNCMKEWNFHDISQYSSYQFYFSTKNRSKKAKAFACFRSPSGINLRIFFKGNQVSVLWENPNLHCVFYPPSIEKSNVAFLAEVPRDSFFNAGLDGILPHWMRYYKSLLGCLQLGELTVPGTHNSASFLMRSWIASPWSSCQSYSLIDQVNYIIEKPVSCL